jgi:hypothetical protein
MVAAHAMTAPPRPETRLVQVAFINLEYGNKAIDTDIDEYRQQNGEEESPREKPAKKDGCRVEEKEHQGG